MTWHVVNRLRHAETLHDVVLSVPDGVHDDPIRQMAQAESIPYFAGSEADLIDRIYKTAREFGADAIVRVTGDCPLTDPDIVDLLVRTYQRGADELDYVSNLRPPTFPHGLDAEVYPTATLRTLWNDIEDPLYREWFPVYLWEHEVDFRTRNVAHAEDLSDLRWTVDYEEDLAFAREIYRRLQAPGRVFRMSDVLELLKAEPGMMKMNLGHTRDENYLRPSVIDPVSGDEHGGLTR